MNSIFPNHAQISTKFSLGFLPKIWDSQSNSFTIIKHELLWDFWTKFMRNFSSLKQIQLPDPIRSRLISYVFSSWLNSFFCDQRDRSGSISVANRRYQIRSRFYSFFTFIPSSRRLDSLSHGFDSDTFIGRLFRFRFLFIGRGRRNWI